MQLKGTDISGWQGDVDFLKLKTATDFVIIKVSEGWGTKWVDSKFIRNQTEARKAGIPLGYYCYTRPDLGNTVEAEVDFLLKTIGTLKTGEMIFLDYEVSYAKPVDWCKRWLDYLAGKLNGYKGIVYLNQSLLNGNDWTPLIVASYGLWLAVYDYNFNAPMPVTKWGTVAFKQFSNKETIPGIVGVADCNVFYGDKPTLTKYGFNPSETTPPVVPPSSEQEIAKLQKQIDSLTNEIIEMRTSRDSWKNKVSELEKEIIKDAQSSTEHIKNLQSTVAEQANQIATMNETIKASSLERKSLLEARSALEEKIIAIAASNETRNEQINKLIGISEDRAEKAEKEVKELEIKLTKKLMGYSWWTRLFSLFKK